MNNKILVRVKEKTWIAWIAAKVLNVNNVAIVFNRTIFLHNASYNDFAGKQSWVLHELKHVEQYQRYGLLHFILLYVYESITRGYKQNQFEEEARAAETDNTLLSKYSLVNKS